MAEKLRIMQMIDSLSIGGAERVSVNYANAISKHKDCLSFHCATREEGLLKTFISDKVETFFMGKKSSLDIKAHSKLIKYIKQNKISIIHAHSSSFFTAVFVKMFTGVKIVWHDHYGHSESVDKRPVSILKYASIFFSYVISVNTILKEWAEKTLYIKAEKIEYIPNYADLTFNDSIPDIPGETGKRIVVLANLRPQKDHINMLKAFLKAQKTIDGWHLLFVGRDWEDSYSNSLKAYIRFNKMDEKVSVLGARSDTAQILKNCDVGVLSSESEGLPLALLEYALASLPVIATDVGECSSVLNNGKAGELINKKDEVALADALVKLMSDQEARINNANSFHKYIMENYSKDAIVTHLIEVYHSL